MVWYLRADLTVTARHTTICFAVCHPLRVAAQPLRQICHMMRSQSAQMLRQAHLKFTRESSGTLTIKSVGADGIRIGDRVWSRSVALTPDRVIDSWNEKPLADLTESDFLALLDDSPELVLLGTGAVSEFAPRELVFAFARRGVGLEVMDSSAAARTFNVLAGEGRRVVAVLVPG